MTLLQMSGAGAVMIGVIWLLRATTRKRLPPGLFPWLWLTAALRLLLPFSLPFRFSAFTGLGRAVDAAASAPSAAPAAARMHTLLPVAAPAPSAGSIQASTGTPSVWLLLWAAGFLFTGLYFLRSYLHLRRTFACSLPVQNAAVRAWQARQTLRRPLRIRRCDHIDTPLAYGLVRPVILLPMGFHAYGEVPLSQVLSHELAHIKALDGLKKALWILCVCVHWFNPAVWCMLYLAGRDIELACDARVLRHRLSQKRDYALTLLDLAAGKRQPHPLVNGFGRYAITERIGSIMRLQKTSLLALLVSLLLAGGLLTAFATSGASQIPDASPSHASLLELPGTLGETYAPAQRLVLEHYKDMPVADFREAVHTLLDQDPSLGLLLDQLDPLSDYQHTNSAVSYLLSTLIPLTAEQWSPRTAAYAVFLDGEDLSQGGIEYALTYTILKPESLTVGAYESTLRGLMEEVDAYLHGLSDQALAPENQAQTEAALDALFESLAQRYSSDAFEMRVDSFAYLPVTEAARPEPHNGLTQDEPPAQAASAEDYQLFLELMKGYETHTVADQRNLLWALFDEGASRDAEEAWSRIVWSTDAYPPALSESESRFLHLSIASSLAANAAENDSYWKGEEVLPSLRFAENLRSETQTLDGITYDVFHAYLEFGLVIEIPDDANLLASQRDAALGAVGDGLRAYADSIDEDGLAAPEAQSRMQEEAERLAAEASSESIKLSIENLRLEVMDERGAYIET